MLPLRDHLPTRTVPFVNYALIATNVLVFLWERVQVANGIDPEALTRGFGFVPAELVTHPTFAVETIFTSMFMHGGLMHVAGNMLYLWIFGDNVEDAMGHVRYLAFYLIGGACAAAAQALASLGDPSAMAMPMVGASGAISAVLAAYALLYPHSPITVLNPVFILWFFFGLFLTFPAWLVIALFFVANLWNALSNTQVGGVAFMAHVGGFVAGLVLLRFFVSSRSRIQDYDRWREWGRRRPRDAW
ncbi:MAG: rhomboid family intramembrane serine protease [Polyangiaceae bacterium]